MELRGEIATQRVLSVVPQVDKLNTMAPYSKGFSSDELQASLASFGGLIPVEKLEKSRYDKPYEGESPKLLANSSAAPLSDENGWNWTTNKKREDIERCWEA